MISSWKKKKGKTLEFVNAESDNLVREKEINNMEWISKEEWGRKIKLKL